MSGHDVTSRAIEPSPLIARLIGHPIATDVAIIGPDGVAGGAGTYGAIGARARAIALTLRAAAGNAKSLAGARVAMLIEPSRTYVDALLGILIAGGCAVPLSPLHTRNELAHALAVAKPIALLTTNDLAPRLGELRTDLPLLLADAPPPPTHAPSPFVPSDAPALMLFTSGTTGTPKGVELSHAAVAATLAALHDAWGWRRRDVLLHTLPLHHTHGLVVALLGALWAGATARVVPFDAPQTWELLGRATLFMGVPTIHHKLIVAFEAADVATRERWSSHARALRLVTSGSAALSPSLLHAFEAATGQRILERYGMTEIGMALSNPLVGERCAGTVGSALPRVDVDIVRDDGARCDVDEPGELRVRSPQMFTAYFDAAGRDESANASAFDVESRFRTGDTGARDARGYVTILGRTSTDILKSGGYKLSALEIEEALRGHEAIVEVAIIGVADATWGDSVTACCVLKDGHALTLDTLRAWCRERMAPYKIPRALHLMSSLPRNAMGKLQKKELATRLNSALPPTP